MGTGLGGHTARTGDPSGPKGYSVTYGDAMLSNKRSWKSGRRRNIHSYIVCLPKQVCYAAASQDMAGHPSADGK